MALVVVHILVKPDLMVPADWLRAHSAFEPDTKDVVEAVVIDLEIFDQITVISFVAILLAIWRPQHLLVQVERQVLIRSTKYAYS